jgi:hypothetical protein
VPPGAEHAVELSPRAVILLVLATPIVFFEAEG